MTAPTLPQPKPRQFRFACAWHEPPTTDPNVSHGICPDCYAKLMAGIPIVQK